MYRFNSGEHRVLYAFLYFPASMYEYAAWMSFDIVFLKSPRSLKTKVSGSENWNSKSVKQTTELDCSLTRFCLVFKMKEPRCRKDSCGKSGEITSSHIKSLTSQQITANHSKSQQVTHITHITHITSHTTQRKDIYSQIKIDPLTCTFSDRMIPNCGISTHKSSI